MTPGRAWFGLVLSLCACHPWDELSRDRVAHVSAEQSYAQAGDLTLADDALDTDKLALASGPFPEGVSFDAEPQEGGGPSLAVLRVRALTLGAGATLRVTGSRPLLVIAAQQITLAGLLDASAYQQTPGPGGAAPGAGRGAGLAGVGLRDATQYKSPGGGGGGASTDGGRGGDAVDPVQPTVAGAAGGKAYGDAAITVLEGGSGGGAGASEPGCASVAGGGGGAVQLFAGEAIHIAMGGGINVGGGGGGGGPNCFAAGSGGGSGGQVFLQSALVDQRGVLAANGGGGGGGASSSGQPDSVGKPGQDGLLGMQPAAGGAPGTKDAIGGAGGRGGAAGAAPQAGVITAGENFNGGGGGGAAGRIHIVAGTFDDRGTNSPAAQSTRAGSVAK